MTAFKSKNKINDYGFTLLEVISSIFIVAVGMGAAFSLMSQTLSASSVVQQRLVAAYLVQEGIEIVKNMRDINWLQARIESSTPWSDGLLPDGDWEVDYTTQTFYDTSDFETCSDVGYHNCDDYDGDFLLIDNGVYNYSSGQPTKFKRKVSLTEIDADTIKILVEVNWQERGRDHSIKAAEEITNWHK